MRRSSHVSLTLLAAFAFSVTACDDRNWEVRDCVDAQGQIVPDSDCNQSGHSGGGFHYVYGGASGGRTGDTVVGGSDEPSPGSRVVSEGEIARGGFGGEGGSGHGGSGE